MNCFVCFVLFCVFCFVLFICFVFKFIYPVPCLFYSSTLRQSSRRRARASLFRNCRAPHRQMLPISILSMLFATLVDALTNLAVAFTQGQAGGVTCKMDGFSNLISRVSTTQHTKNSLKTQSKSSKNSFTSVRTHLLAC